VRVSYILEGQEIALEMVLISWPGKEKYQAVCIPICSVDVP